MLWVSSPQAYFIADTDLRKDPNMQRTILSRMLDISQRLLTRRGLDMPRHVVFHVPCFNLRRVCRVVSLVCPLVATFGWGCTSCLGNRFP